MFWVVFALALGSLVLGFCFGFAVSELRGEARDRRRAERKGAGL